MVELMGRLHVEMFPQDRVILNGVDVKTRLVRSKDTFALMAVGHQHERVREKGDTEYGRTNGSHQGTRQRHTKVTTPPC